VAIKTFSMTDARRFCRKALTVELGMIAKDRSIDSARSGQTPDLTSAIPDRQRTDAKPAESLSYAENRHGTLPIPPNPPRFL
jgi:succinylglutamate desuccinylase